ncbi:caspase family protein [Streptomyces cellulosae]
MTPDEAAASRAVLFGVHDFKHLNALDGIRHNAPALRKILTTDDVGGLSDTHCVVVPPDSTQGDVLDAVYDAAAEAEHLLLVYYAGHGHFGGDGRHLLLATAASHLQRSHHSVPYEHIRALVADSKARHRIVIIDCCFSGLALHMGDQPVEITTGPNFEIQGACVLTSAAQTQRSLCLPEGSVFTLELVSLLQNGLSGVLPDGRRGEDQPTLTVADIFETLCSRLDGRTVDGHPVPQPQLSTQGSGHRIPLALNRSYISGRKDLLGPLGSQYSHAAGNRYEGAWIVRHLLYVLLGGAHSIRIESTGREHTGVSQFTYRRGDSVEVHRSERNNHGFNTWTVTALHEKGIWTEARSHVEGGRTFHFISPLPARPLQELADRARRSESLRSFVEQWLTADLRDIFDQLASHDIFGSADTAWKVIRGFWFSWPDAHDTERMNTTLAELLLNGATGQLAIAALLDLIEQNLGIELDRESIETRLAQYGLQRTPQEKRTSFPGRITSITAGWISSVERELLSPAIPRTESRRLAELASGSDRLLLLMGAGGGGKSAILQQFVSSIDTAETPVLAFRLDRLESFPDTTALGEQIGLDVSPVTALASVAGTRPSILVVDQVDAVSVVSGRMPRNFDAVADLVREAEAFPNMRIVLACRKFDVENDYRLRELVDEKKCARIEVRELTEEQVGSAIGVMGLNIDHLNERQRKLLRSPLNLLLLSKSYDGTEALSFHTNKQLFDGFWQRKLTECVQRKESVQFNKVITALADEMSVRQQLSVPVTFFDAEDLILHARVLISEHVLVEDDQKIAFFHESFFDYAFARSWIVRHQSIVDFLLTGEQELFRRAQVRQILNHLREMDPGRFVSNVESLLTHPEVRFHIKDVVLSLLVELPDPTTEEWEMVDRILATQPKFSVRLRRALRTAPWFERVDEESVIGGWLEGANEEEQSLAVEIMAGGTGKTPDRIAELLRAHLSAPQYPKWLRWLAQVTKLHDSRPFFELVLEAVRDGLYVGAEQSLWHSAYELAEHQPAWAIELLHAHLAERPNAMTLNDKGKIVALLERDHSANQLLEVGARKAPETFCDLLLPYMLRAMAKTAKTTAHDRPVLDSHFSYRYPQMRGGDLEDTLLASAVAAIGAVVERDAKAAEPVLRMLATDPHDASQWLLYEGLKVAGAVHAQWAAEILLEDKKRLISGYMSNAVWKTRELILATSSFMPADSFKRIEHMILTVRFSWEGGRSSRWYQFNLLSAMDEDRLSERGRRRLAELRRRHLTDHPAEPKGIVADFLRPPISSDAAKRMSDAQWLRAIAKYNEDRRDWEHHTGGASEQSRVLQESTKEDPVRFANLALRFTASTNPVYGDAILLGLSEAETVTDPSPVFAAVRHLASLRASSNDRWLGSGLRKYLRQMPHDLIELLVDRAINSRDPEDGTLVVRTTNASHTEGRDIWTSGINTTRGSAAETLGDILIYDTDGSRTALVSPIMMQLANDRAITVRSCAAHLIHASMRHAQPQALEAFSALIQTDDALLATQPVVRLIWYVGRDNFPLVYSVIDRMLTSEYFEVREAGGQLAAAAAAQWGESEFLMRVLHCDDTASRKGAAAVCAHEIAAIPSATPVLDAYSHFIHDPEAEVRASAALLAPAIRGARLRPLRMTIKKLIASPTFSEASTQLLITLQDAPDRVDDLALECAQRFIEINGSSSADIRTGAAADAKYIGELVIRAYVQSTNTSQRSKALNILDDLLLFDAFGVSELILSAER